MKKFALALIATLAFASFAIAGDTHHEGEENAAHETHAAPKTTKGKKQSKGHKTPTTETTTPTGHGDTETTTH